MLAGCASPQAQAPLPSFEASAASATNVAGQYQGNFLLKNTVIGKAFFDLTQSGTSVGGKLKLVLSGGTIHEPVAMTLDTADNTLTGTAVDASGNPVCTYALSASYNPKTFVLRGTSSPLTCKGKVATFRTTERCFYNTGSSNATRRNATGIIEC